MSEKKNWVKAIYKFDATESNELSIQPGDVILITKNDERFDLSFFFSLLIFKFLF